MASVIIVGKFDGVHRGHASLLTLGRQLADQHGAQLVAMPMDPHPATLLAPGTQPPRMVSLVRKCQLLRELGANQVEVLTPDAQLLNLMAEDFVRSLVEQFAPVVMVEGEDFRFGKARRGDIAMLRAMGQELGFAVEVAPKLSVGLSDQLVMPVRSTLIRWLIEHGRMHDVAYCLGRHYSLCARVVGGEKRGRTLGFPTANLANDDFHDFVMPGRGVYAGYARTVDADTQQPTGLHHAAAISLGAKPTFGPHEAVVEAHLLDFDGDLYDQTLEVVFMHWLRDQQRYPSVDLLQAQLGRDVARARALWVAQGDEIPQPAYLERAGFQALTP